MGTDIDAQQEITVHFFFGGGDARRLAGLWGCAAPMGSFFTRNHYNVGIIFYKNIPKQGSVFPKFSLTFLGISLYFEKKKSLKMCTLTIQS